ncbi:MAG TPA: hypothetical protein PK265_00585 [Candidatus Saccharibacteria bacterium]|nr:hypothetical protein [Candidatus Saccharibacteria bacterium]HRQ97810.1 hypothetical protein [Candidatus Saccharibacteria bacterium]
MGKNKKKRNKVYTGVDAAVTKPVITRITAVNRSKIGQWWFDNKRIAKPVLITSGVVIVIIVLILQIVRIASGG